MDELQNHPRCDCHACTQARAQERNPFYTPYQPPQQCQLCGQYGNHICGGYRPAQGGIQSLPPNASIG
jgi:hypothetical protein